MPAARRLRVLPDAMVLAADAASRADCPLIATAGVAEGDAAAPPITGWASIMGGAFVQGCKAPPFYPMHRNCEQPSGRGCPHRIVNRRIAS